MDKLTEEKIDNVDFIVDFTKEAKKKIIESGVEDKENMKFLDGILKMAKVRLTTNP